MTFKYTLMQISYWILFCCVYIFANPYLSQSSFTVGQIGMIIGLSALISVFMQPLTAKILDTNKKITVNLIVILFTIAIILSISIIPFITNKLFIAFLFIIALIGINNLQTFIYTFIFEYINKGYNVNFGLARGIGSVAFSITATILGIIGNKYGYSFIPFASISLAFIFLVSTIYFDNNIFKTHELTEDTSHTTFKEFYYHHKKYIYLLMGISLIFIGHNSIVIFFKNIIEGINASSSNIGLGITVASAVELPIMMLFSYINKKIKIEKLFILASLGFSVKLIITLIGLYTNSIVIIFVAQFTQMFAFALYMPTSVYYVNTIMPTKDKIKGQAYLGTAVTIGGILGNSLTGYMLEAFSLNISFTIITILSLIGTTIVCINIKAN